MQHNQDNWKNQDCHLYMETLNQPYLYDQYENKADSNAYRTPIRSVLDALQQGGYILYARHAEATVGVDQPNLNFHNCYTQRNLSYNGRNQAVIFGDTIRRLGIPVMTPILASPLCRAVDTAVLAFGQEQVQIDPYWAEILRLSYHIPPVQQKNILNYLQSYLELQPATGTNRVIIAHGFPSGVGLGQMPNMGTIIVRPLGPGNGYEIVEKLRLSDLGRLG